MELFVALYERRRRTFFFPNVKACRKEHSYFLDNLQLYILYNRWKLSYSEGNPQAFGRNSAFAKLIESLVAQFSPSNHGQDAVLCRRKHIGL